MKIQDFLIQQKVNRTHAERKGTDTPLYRYSANGRTIIPDSLVSRWIETGPTVEEMALYYMGVLNQREGAFCYSLRHAERYHGYQLPAVYGILSPEFWEQWRRGHVIELMDAQKAFYETGIRGSQ